MEAQKSYMQAHFAGLESAELERLILGDQLTDIARDLACTELKLRGIDVNLNAQKAAPSDEIDLGSFQSLRQFLDPTEAHMAAACLQANGVPAFVADANLVQTNMLLSIAVGGVRLQVPQAMFVEAEAILAAYDRGEFALDDTAFDTSPDA